MKKLFSIFKILLFALVPLSVLGQNNSHDSQKLDSIVINSIRAGKNTPVSYTEVHKEQIQGKASSYSLPMLLALEPSVVATTEGGGGLGYSKMSIRGTDDSRTNVTLNGVTMNDGESQQVFWVNLPSIQGFLHSVQLQRGVGTSVNGTSAFGASINMQTNKTSQDAHGTAQFSYGSYQTYMSTITAGTGLLKSGLSFDVIFSHNTTDGYIRNAKADLNSLYTSLGWRNDKNSIKFNYIFGDQKTGITWEGNPLEVDPSNPKDNYYANPKYNAAGKYYDDAGNIHYYDNETDNYKQHYLQLVYTHQFNPFLSWNTVLNFTKGDGYYENYKYDAKFSKYGLENQIIDGETYKRSDFIIKQGMDNYYYVATTTLNYNKNKLRSGVGATFSFYDGGHNGNVLWSKYNNNIPDNYGWYNNTGYKRDASIYARAEYDIASWVTAYVDLQYRHIDYRLIGEDKDFANLDKTLRYNFFNPKAGFTFIASERSRFYASVAVAHREPSRTDVKENIKAGDKGKFKHERLIDYEIGYKYNSAKLALSANIYLMEYKDQFVASGKLTDNGWVIKENIPHSYRRGIELSATYQPISKLSISANATFSKNKLKNYTAYIDTYDNPEYWTPVNQTEIFYDKSNLTLSPEVISSGLVTYSPRRTLSVSFNCKYVGKQYMNNTSDDYAKVPSYFVAGLNAVKTFNLRNSSLIELSATVDNIFNRKYYSYGWIYEARFADGSDRYTETGVYAQAGTNFMFRVSYKF